MIGFPLLKLEKQSLFRQHWFTYSFDSDLSDETNCPFNELEVFCFSAGLLDQCITYPLRNTILFYLT